VSFKGSGRKVKITDKPDPGMPPMIAPGSAGSFLALWSERYEGGARIRGKTVTVSSPGGLAVADNPDLIDDPGGGPRSADLAALGGGNYALVFSDARQAEYALIKVQKLAPAK
jgi:hypothetical protein